MSGDTSLDRYLHNSAPKNDDFSNATFSDSVYLSGSDSASVWSKKQRRAFQRVLSGLKRSQYLGAPIRFMTLTSASTERWELINRDFAVLRGRITRRFGKMEYFKIKTNEGNGVMHILYRGSFIPQSWLSDQWKDIHDSPIVDIRLFRSGGKTLARYLATQYLTVQSFERISWSWKWVCRGFVRIWHQMVSTYGFKVALRKWDMFLQNPPRVFVEFPLEVWS